MGVTLTSDGAAVVVAGAGGTIWVRKQPERRARNDDAIGVLRHRSSTNRTRMLSIMQSRSAHPLHVMHLTIFTSDIFRPGSRFRVIRGGFRAGWRVSIPTGNGTFVAASALAGDANIHKVVYNCAPAVSVDGSRVYVSVNQSSFSYGYLCMAAAPNLRPQRSIMLRDPRNGQPAALAG